METLFLTSLALLIVVLAVRYVECRRTVRFGMGVRTTLDNYTVATALSLKRWLLATLEYIHKDVVLKALHIVSYVALMLVRWVEARLDRGTKFIRHFRHRRRTRDDRP